MQVLVEIDHFPDVPNTVVKTILSKIAPYHSYGTDFNKTLDVFDRFHSYRI